MHIIYLIIFLAFYNGENNSYSYPTGALDQCNCLVQSDTLFVTHNLDNGEGSLRCAIECAALTGGKEVISFAIPPEQDSVITLFSPLPSITANTWIINEGGQIFVDGSQLNGSANQGFRLEGDSIIIRGLHIRNFPNNAIDNYQGNEFLVIENNIIYNNGRLSPSGDGLDFRFSSFVLVRNNRIFQNGKDGAYLQNCSEVYLTGNEFLSNGANGINMLSSTHIDFGDDCNGCGNTVIGNTENGIRASFNSSHLNILNNFIGIKATQVQAIPNKEYGIFLSNCDTVQIGRPGAGNMISGNLMSGIFSSDSTNQVLIQNNRIGYSIVEGLAMPNGISGIELRNTHNAIIGGDSSLHANEIGFQPNHVLLKDSSQFCQIKSNEFFCSINGINIEAGSNTDFQHSADFEIMNSTSIAGSTDNYAHIQAYLRNQECNPCQGNLFLGSVTSDGGDWTIEFDHSLEEGDQISLIISDMEGNSTGFSECKSYSCQDFEVNIVPVDQNYICQNGTLVLSTDTGAQYEWSTGETSAQIEISEGGDYWVKVFNEMDCPSIDSIYIPTFVSPNLELMPSDSTVFCNDGVLLKAFGQGSFEWSTGQQGPIIMADSSGYYCVSLTNQYNCVTEACVSITKGEKVVPHLELEGDTVFCEGNSVKLIAGGGVEYKWNHNGYTGNELTVASTGLYSVTITNEFGCTDSISQEITVHPAVDAYILPAGYLIICPGDSVELTAYGGDNYLWDNNDTTNSIIVNDWGNYSVSVTNEFGCEDVVSRSVSVKPNVEASIVVDGPHVLCEPESVWLLVDYEKMDSIRWNTGDTGDSLLVTASGTYVAEIFNLGCSTTDSVEIIVYPSPPGVDSIVGPTWSYVDSIQSFNIYEPSEGIVYEWEVDGGLILSTTNTELEVLWTEEGIGLICANAIDSNLCVSNTYCKIIDLAALKSNSLKTTDVFIYPNPASGILNIETTGIESYGPLNLEFYSPNGLLVSTKKLEIIQGSESHKLDVSDIPGGIYWVKIPLNNDRYIFEKILLNH